MNTTSLMKRISSWEGFQNKLLELPKKQKGDAFELLTKLYFKINPVYSFYDEVWLLSEVPQKDLEYLGLPSHDLGIDLIAKSGNEYHAIQCKYHSDKNQSVTFSEVSTFTTHLGNNSKLSKGYICTSAISTSRNFDKVDKGNVIKIMSDSWEQLDEDFFKQVHILIDKKKIKIEPFKPREHQEKALKEAVQYFNKENHSRGKLIFPCGAGKSLTGFWFTQVLKSKSTLIAVPSLSLVKQTLEVYLREIVAHNTKVKWLCICSDEGIGRNDDVVYYTENLGVPCITNPEYIENWLAENRDEHKIIFTTYQSGRIIAEISQKINFSFDVGIFDEAHKTVGSDKKLFSHLLFDENISIDKRIFMTATERFYAGSKDDIISMDDYDIYGDTFAQMSFKEAIELELLTDYKVITIDIKKSEISEFIKENNLIQLNDKWKKETEARSLASMLALRKAMKQFPIKNAVSFHSSIEKAVRNKELQQHITDTYNYLPIDTYTVSGKQPTSKRNDIVQEFANSEKALITNARCLTEGVDVPNIDCIVFADPRKSKVDIVQALGRALRKKKGKDWGYVILPVVYDEETEEIDNDNFNEILAVVRGLASNDERIIDYLKDKSKGEGTKAEEREKAFNLDVFSEYLNEEELTKQLQIKLWDKLAKYNWMPFEEAREFVRGLGLVSQNEWNIYCQNKMKPNNIPSNPDKKYKETGWLSLQDWIGTNIGFDGYNYLPFKEAREYVRALKLANTNDWKTFLKSGEKPENIPYEPNIKYKNTGWLSFYDWIGTKAGFEGCNYLPFEEAREFARGLKLSSYKEWNIFCKSGKKPENIPYSPSRTYLNSSWISMGDWLGTNTIAPQKMIFLNFKDARKFVWNLNLKNQSEWNKYCQGCDKPIFIPSNPNKKYKNKGWKSYPDWLGTEIGFEGYEYLPLDEAKKYIHKLKIKSQSQWAEYLKSGNRPKFIPSSPGKYYKDKGWISWGDWLGTGRVADKNKVYLSYNEAKDCVKRLNIKNQKEWVAYCKSGNKPLNIPAKPQRTYLNKGWKGLGDWLGKE